MNKTIASMILTAAFGVHVATPLSASGTAVECEAPEDREDVVWCAASEKVMDYMKESTASLAAGHEVAYDGFAAWYNNEFLPLVSDEPPIEVFMRFFSKAITQLLTAGVSPGPFVEQYVLPAAETWFDGVVAGEEHQSPRSVILALSFELKQLKKDLLVLPDEFEAGHPGLFEEAMEAYFLEEMDTPGIHASSDYKMGEQTRAKLAELGFPEPSRATIDSIAEAVLVPLVHQTKLEYQSDALAILEPEDVELDARIAARRLLFPDRPDYYCEGAWQLGMLTPDDCR